MNRIPPALAAELDLVEAAYRIEVETPMNADILPWYMYDRRTIYRRQLAHLLGAMAPSGRYAAADIAAAETYLRDELTDAHYLETYA